MSETELNPEGETLVAKTVPETPEVKEEKKFSEKDLMRLFMILEGQNPDTQQTITDFLDMNDPVATSNLPNRRDVQLIVYLDLCSKFYFPTLPNNPFEVLKTSIANALKAKGGEKAKQFVDIVRNQPDLSGLQNLQEPQKQSFIDRALGRSGT